MRVDRWLQPCAVFSHISHIFSGISWHMPQKYSLFNCMILSWWPCHEIVSFTLHYISLEMLSWVSLGGTNAHNVSPSASYIASWYQFILLGKQGLPSISSLSRVIGQKINILENLTRDLSVSKLESLTHSTIDHHWCFIHSAIDPSTHMTPLTHSTIYSLTHSTIYSLTHSTIDPPIYWWTEWSQARQVPIQIWSHYSIEGYKTTIPLLRTQVLIEISYPLKIECPYSCWVLAISWFLTKVNCTWTVLLFLPLLCSLGSWYPGQYGSIWRIK